MYGCDRRTKFRPENIYETQDPVILHYVVCGLPWLRAKYAMLGAFPNSWYGGKIPIAPSFHRDARDLFVHNSRDNENQIRSFFKNQVMLDIMTDSSEYKNLISSGVCERIVKPRNILRRKESYNTYDTDGTICPNQTTTSKYACKPYVGKAKVQKIVQPGSHTKNDSNKINSNGMTYDKNWMIANAVKKFCEKMVSD